MSDLVGNHEDRFSHNEVHIQTIDLYNIKGIHDILILKLQDNNNNNNNNNNSKQFLNHVKEKLVLEYSLRCTRVIEQHVPHNCSKLKNFFITQ